MEIKLNMLARQLKTAFAAILRYNVQEPKLRFFKKRLAGHVSELSFVYPREWPHASYTEMNAALLALHHAGYIFYGANSVTINKTILDPMSAPV